MLSRELVEDAMRRALALARRSPAHDRNPQVGCVIVSADGRIVAEGWHQGAGTPHAEVDALTRLPAEWRERASELTAVVTLEPCNHLGHTGPCAVALADAGIGAVAYALEDPNPVAGGGAETLRATGVEVRGGVLDAEAARLLTPWLARQRAAYAADPQSEVSEEREGSRHAPASPLPRPHVTLKCAQTIDGRAAAADGSSRWITGPEARADVHRRRAEADAIMVGTGTLLADDPELTARSADGSLLVPAAEQPVPVVVGHRPIPGDAKIKRHPAGPAIRFSGDDLPAHLADLAERGVRRLFVEGGPALESALIAAGLVDEILVYVAPALLGGPNLALGDIGVEGIAGILRVDLIDTERLGDDWLLIARAPAASDPTRDHTTEVA